MQTPPVASTNPLLAAMRSSMLTSRRAAATTADTSSNAPNQPLQTTAMSFSSVASAQPQFEHPADNTDDRAPQDNRTHVQKLLADWGKSDSRYDLDKNGTVGMSDLLDLLKRLGQTSSAPPPTGGGEVVPETGDTPMTPLEKLMADWGKSDSEFDLNGDGTVNMRDLMQMLGEMRQDRLQTNKTPELAPAREEEKSHLDRLKEDWGKTDSVYDLDGDGTVGMTDLLMLLRHIGKGGTDVPQAPPPGNPETGTEELTPLQKLLADWGKTDSDYDLDGNGTVDMRDLLRLLEEMGQGEGKMGGAQGPTGSDARLSPVDRLIEAWKSGDLSFDLNDDGTVGIQDLLELLSRLNPQMPQEASANGVETPERRGVERDGNQFRQRSPVAWTSRQASAAHIASAMMHQAIDPERMTAELERRPLDDTQKQFVRQRLALLSTKGQNISLVG